MLDTLSFTNFRAFRSLPLKFSKLNIFVGPNNSGKSSIISAINLIAQNVKLARYGSSLSLNGPYVDLGTYYDVVYDHKANSNMKVEFSIGDYSYEYNFRYRLQRREIELFKAVIADKKHRYTYNQKKEGVSHKFQNIETGKIIPTGRLRLRIIGFSFYIPLSNQSSEVGGDLEREGFINLRTLLLRATGRLDSQFRAFDSIGAFRAPPQRTYLYSGEAPVSVGRNGENSAEIIASSSSSREREARHLMQRTSAWFENAGVAKNIKIRPLTNRHFELNVEDRVGFSNNIVDAGFGCSQALPVIIGGYKVMAENSGPTNSMYVVQEPEIHLHPDAAAHMGTFFCQLAKYGTQCFVETHSDSLILRVARHVANKHLSPDDVRIFWVSDKDGSRDVSLLEFKEDGTFANNWPDGFFPTRSVETLELARASSNISNRVQLELDLDD